MKILLWELLPLNPADWNKISKSVEGTKGNLAASIYRKFEKWFLNILFSIVLWKISYDTLQKNLNVWLRKNVPLFVLYYKIFSGTIDNSKMNCHFRPLWNYRIFFTHSDFSSLKILSSKVPIYAMVVCLQTFKNNVISRSMTCTWGIGFFGKVFTSLFVNHHHHFNFLPNLFLYDFCTFLYTTK